MSKTEKKGEEASPEELRTAERLIWLNNQQETAVTKNEPIKTVFRVTVAVDVCVDGVEEAKASILDLKGRGIFVYGIKGVRRLEPLFGTSEAFKSVTERLKKGK